VKTVRKLAVFGAYLLGVVVLGLDVLEVAAWVLVSKRLQKTPSLYEAVLSGSGNVLDMKRNYRVRWETEEFAIDVSTNGRGFREDFEFSDPSVDVAFMGDSFAFGHGVNASDRISNVAANAVPGVTVVSLSYNNGFQPEHYEYFLQLHPELRPKLLVVEAYLGNDFDADLAETRIVRDPSGNILSLELPEREIYAGNLVSKKHYQYQWMSRLVESTYLGKFLAIQINTSPNLRLKFWKQGQVLPNTPNRLSTERGDLDAHNLRALTALRRIRDMMNARGGKLHVLLVPQNYLLGKAKRPHLAPENLPRAEELRARNGLMKALLARCAESALECHDLAPVLALDDYFEGDAHWSARGHAKVGRFVGEIIASALGRRR